MELGSFFWTKKFPPASEQSALSATFYNEWRCSSLRHRSCWLAWVQSCPAKALRAQRFTPRAAGCWSSAVMRLYVGKCPCLLVFWEGAWFPQYIRTVPDMDENSVDFSSKDEQKKLLSCPSVRHSLVVDVLTLEVRNAAFHLLLA